MNSPKKIAVVIPAYKAANTLPSVLKRIPDDVMIDINWILVVEDAGKNIPPSCPESLKTQYPKIQIHYHEENMGYGAAQKTGYKAALALGADIVVLLHADGQYAPEEMKRLYTPLINDQADMILGSRMRDYRSALQGGMPVYKFIANICLTKLENIAYGMKLSEYHSGYMIYSRKALEIIPFEKLSNTFHFDGEMLLMGGKKGLRIADLPIPTHYGDEESHLKPIKYGFEVLKVIKDNYRGKYDRLFEP